MPRRLFALLAVLGLLLVVVACQGAPAAPALTDPKDILSRSVLALKDVKTVQVKGELTGTVTIPNSGPLDLKGTTFDLSADIPAKKLHAAASVPAFLGTSADAIFVDNALYYKVAGPLAGMVGADPTGKYTKSELPAASAGPSASGDTVQTDPLKAIDAFKAQLDKLPAPTKAADEKCGDKDCYHVVMKLTEKDLAAVDPSAATSLAGTPFTLTLDVWSQKNDLRPAKVAFGVDAGTNGTFTLTLTLTYDQALSISAPAADQIAP
jgi:hypothetical protein